MSKVGDVVLGLMLGCVFVGLFAAGTANVEIVSTEAGFASVYSIASNGGTVVACPGQQLDDTSLLAAHRTFPCGAKVRVTSLENGKLVDVRIIDRGPYVAGRIIDLNPAAALALGASGLMRVSITKM